MPTSIDKFHTTWFMYQRRRHSIPLVNGITISHTLITPTAYRSKIRKCKCTTLGLRNIMTNLEIKGRNFIGTPCHTAFRIKRSASMLNPHLFTQCFGYWCLAMMMFILLLSTVLFWPVWHIKGY
jgi:hypothetical protein